MHYFGVEYRSGLAATVLVKFRFRGAGRCLVNGGFVGYSRMRALITDVIVIWQSIHRIPVQEARRWIRWFP